MSCSVAVSVVEAVCGVGRDAVFDTVRAAGVVVNVGIVDVVALAVVVVSNVSALSVAVDDLVVIAVLAAIDDIAVRVVVVEFAVLLLLLFGVRVALVGRCVSVVFVVSGCVVVLGVLVCRGSCEGCGY